MELRLALLGSRLQRVEPPILGPGLEALRRAHVRLQVALCPSTKQHLRRLRHARPHGFFKVDVWVPNIQEAGQPTSPGLNNMKCKIS